jgi:hypothetical protein
MLVYAVADPSVYSMPYIIALLVCIVVFSGLLLSFKSLRNFHRKLSLIVYAVMVLVSVLLVYLAYDAGLGPTYVGYDYAFGTDVFQPDLVNQFNITLTSSGLRAASYLAVLKTVNASFSTENPTNYIRVNETTIKIPLTYQPTHKAVNTIKPVFFTINTGAPSFSMDIYFESLKDTKILVTTYTNPISCIYNSTLNSYAIGPIYRATA